MILLLLRATLREINFRLAYDMTPANPLDDVVFIDVDKKECLLIQVKHSINQELVNSADLFPGIKTKTGEKGGFSLYKYLKSYPYNVQHLPEKKSFILFTNRPLEKSIKLEGIVKIFDKHEKQKPILYSNDSTEKPRGFKPIVPKKMIEYVKETFQKDISEEDVSSFYEKLTLLFNQPDLHKCIENELLGWMKTWMHPVFLGKTDSKTILAHCRSKLTEFVEKHMGTFLTLTDGRKCLDEIQKHCNGINKPYITQELKDLAMVEYVDRFVANTDN